MSGEMAQNMTAGQAEPGTRLKCDHCVAEFTPKNRNGVLARFCSDACRDRWKNARRLKGAALLKDKKPTNSRRPSPGKQRVDLAVIPEAERPALLVEAARRLGLTEEGPILRKVRQRALKGEQVLKEASCG